MLGVLSYSRCVTTTLTVRITEEKKRLAKDKASPMSLSAWVHGLIDRELNSGESGLGYTF